VIRGRASLSSGDDPLALGVVAQHQERPPGAFGGQALLHLTPGADHGDSVSRAVAR
jgi:hypothetical protein